jgi:hypothetical protein
MLIPVVVTNWPTILPVLVAAAGALGFTAGREKVRNVLTNKVSVPVKNGEFVTDGLAAGASLEMVRGDVTLRFFLDRKGQCQVEASGSSMSKAELERLATTAAGKVVQMYAYHKLVTEAKNQGFTTVEEQVDERGAIRIRLRKFE